MTDILDEMLSVVLQALAATSWLAMQGMDQYRPLHKRIQEPTIGDLVLEVSNPGSRPIDRIGVLLSKGMENPPASAVDPATYDEQAWGRPYPPYMEMTYRIRTVDGREVPWVNCRFIAIPQQICQIAGRKTFLGDETQLQEKALGSHDA